MCNVIHYFSKVMSNGSRTLEAHRGGQARLHSERRHRHDYVRGLRPGGRVAVPEHPRPAQAEPVVQRRWISL